MNTNNLKILVVDDEKEICEYASSHFKRKGYVALVANSGEEALVIIKEQNPDIMFLDMHLPNMSGVELLKLVRGFNKTIKVIIISGYDIDSSEPEFKELDILEVVHKPAPLDVFDAMLEKITVKEKDGSTQVNP